MSTHPFVSLTRTPPLSLSACGSIAPAHVWHRVVGALDDVVMDSWVTSPPLEESQLKDEAKEGVYVYGLFLDGCKWSGKENRLVDSDPKKLFAPLPVLHVTGVNLAKQTAEEKKRLESQYYAPAYRVKQRTGLNFIATFPLNAKEQEIKSGRWIMRGVALLCSVD